MTAPAGTAPPGQTPALCRHCGLPVPVHGSGGRDYCCAGCAAAHALIAEAGLDAYYQRRCLDPDTPPPRPEDTGPVDYAAAVIWQTGAEGQRVGVLHLMVEGLHCAACVWLIEHLLARQPGILQARVNMTTRRLTVRFVPQPSAGHPQATDPGGEDREDREDREQDDGGANALLAPVVAVGYRLVPFDPARLEDETRRSDRRLVQALAVAGFAAGNVMLFSVSVWAGVDMGPGTRDLMHWLSALVALPAIVFAIGPFAGPAWRSLRAGRPTMDLPITLAVVLAAVVSLWETMQGGPHAYFDAAVMLLFFLLLGRLLDSRARGRARAAADHLLRLGATTVAVIAPGGGVVHTRPDRVAPGALVLVATGERIGVDGTVVDGQSEVDTTVLTGETLPRSVGPGDAVFAGSLNLAAPLRLRAAAVGEETVLAAIVRMMEAAEQGRARFVVLADRIARAYVPVVHGLALATGAGWVVLGGMPWDEAVLTAAAVLIVTCPCALALAVPVVQVVASGRLMRRGLLVTSATALERLARIDTVVFDKTGTLTLGRPRLQPAAPGGGLSGTGGGGPAWTREDLAAAASLAQVSRHPLARALVAAAQERLGPIVPRDGVVEVAGEGLTCPATTDAATTDAAATDAATTDATTGGAWRLGRAAWCGVSDADAASAALPTATDATPTPPGPCLWFARPGWAPVCFVFTDDPRPDAAAVVADLRAGGIAVAMLSGDRAPVVAALADRLGIADWWADQTPADKVARITGLGADGRRVLMVGDGVNDAPALAAAQGSVALSQGTDVARAAADVILQGDHLAPVLDILAVARRADWLVRQNLALSFGYNAVMVPLAVAGLVTPLIAAIAMSASSLLVVGNALRLDAGRRPAPAPGGAAGGRRAGGRPDTRGPDRKG